MMKTELKGFLISTITITILGFLVQFGVGELTGKQIALSSLIIVYSFLLSLNILVHLGVLAVKKHDQEKMGMAFLAGTVIKMLAALTFLLPILMNPKAGVLVYVIHFFVAYGIYLVHELILMLKLIKVQNHLKG